MLLRLGHDEAGQYPWPLCVAEVRERVPPHAMPCVLDHLTRDAFFIGSQLHVVLRARVPVLEDRQDSSEVGQVVVKFSEALGVSASLATRALRVFARK